jgi:glyoxylase-like metal-dependent hydrolase (beta-lactamase superfamily II)
MKLSNLFGALVVLSLVLLGVARAQRDFSNVEIKSTPVSGNIHMLEGSGGNIGVSVGVDGLLIVDDQFAPLADKIEAALARLDQGNLKFVLNTHWHGDHTGGNAHFGRNASIVAHTNVRKRLVEADRTPKEGLPVITFDRSLSLHFNEEEIKVIHLPSGHTDGAAPYVMPESGCLRESQIEIEIGSALVSKYGSLRFFKLHYTDLVS